MVLYATICSVQRYEYALKWNAVYNVRVNNAKSIPIGHLISNNIFPLLYDSPLTRHVYCKHQNQQIYLISLSLLAPPQQWGVGKCNWEKANVLSQKLKIKQLKVKYFIRRGKCYLGTGTILIVYKIPLEYFCLLMSNKEYDKCCLCPQTVKWKFFCNGPERSASFSRSLLI